MTGRPIATQCESHMLIHAAPQGTSAGDTGG
eukprot:CAMPEP_0173069128 /NCGR_PEP_ID=MMETSP1102-20130122/7826_1 /TAXON_ID=49646 /ORGANISM="Geminigera sp., Strain Caron Lab Isolate" /LENGTH=30 /DNA_ID= /DNA_START= /DNA_END= /DNA_ORIENTATION=